MSILLATFLKAVNLQIAGRLWMSIPEIGNIRAYVKEK